VFLADGDDRDLHVHGGAAAAIKRFVELGVVGHYPMYLVGLALPEHRGGPALVTLLTLPNGAVLEARARSSTKSINNLLKFDVEYCDVDDLHRYRRLFYGQLGGFGSAGCLESSPTIIAEHLLSSCDLALQLAEEVGPHPHGPPRSYPSDWTDAVYYSERAIGCVVEGFTPSVDQLLSAPVPDKLRREMGLGDVGPEWLAPIVHLIISEVDARVVDLLREAWAVQVASPRSSIALLRTVAEIVAMSLKQDDDDRLFEAINHLEAGWTENPPDSGPSGRREAAWRAALLADLDTLRDLGRSIHANASPVSPSVLQLAFSAAERLLETTLRVNPLHRMTT
jgi:hypothetical protein